LPGLTALSSLTIIGTPTNMLLEKDQNGIANGHVPQNGDGASNGHGPIAAQRRRNL
jgi:hypothetical protein